MPIYNAQIEILNAGVSRTATTNKKGNYSLKNLNFDTCTLKIMAVGYLPSEYEITLKQNGVLAFDAKMLFIPQPANAPVPANI